MKKNIIIILLALMLIIALITIAGVFLLVFLFFIFPLNMVIVPLITLFAVNKIGGVFVRKMNIIDDDSKKFFYVLLNIYFATIGLLFIKSFAWTMLGGIINF